MPGAPQNVGALRVDHELRGTLKTLTPLRGLEVFIIAEPEPMRASAADRAQSPPRAEPALHPPSRRRGPGASAPRA